MTAALQKTYVELGAYEPDLMAVCAHEAGHAVVALRFGLASDCFIAGRFSGVCKLRGKVGALALAEIGWGGVMAEDLLGWRDPRRKPLAYKLDTRTVYQWTQDAFPEASDEDQQAIKGWPDRHESAKLALKILTENYECLKIMARYLADTSRERFDEACIRDDFRIDQQLVEDFVADYEAQQASERMVEINARAYEILASLPPVPLPATFDFESLMAATGASESTFNDFVADRVRRDRQAVGSGGVTADDCQVMQRFFHESAGARAGWIHLSRELIAFQRKANQNETIQ